MNYAIVGSLTALLAGAGLALAEPPAPSLPAPRALAAATNEVPADQAVPAGPFGPPPGAVDGAGPVPPSACSLSGPCGPPERWWVGGEYLLWWLKESRFPPLLTTGPRSSLGIIGQPGTRVLVGDDNLDRPQRSGGRLTAGGWITEYQGFGLEISAFWMESVNRSVNAVSTGAPDSAVLARPFFNVLTGREDSLLVTFPGAFSGTVTSGNTTLQCDTGRLMGGEFHFIANLCCESDYRIDFLVGYRYLSLDDHFGLTENTVAAPNLGGAITSILDRIDTTNRFNGGQLGLRGEWRYNRWLVRASATAALGETDETAGVFGTTTIFVPGRTPTVLPSGFLALPSNSGTTTNAQFSVVSEVGLSLSYQLLDCLRLSAGYNFLYWNNVARSGDQANRNINVLEVPVIAGAGIPTLRTGPAIRCNDFWAHGITAGLELRY